MKLSLCPCGGALEKCGKSKHAKQLYRCKTCGKIMSKSGAKTYDYDQTVGKRRG